MTVKLGNLVLDIERTRENETGDVEILDKDVLEILGEVVSRKVVKAYLVDYEDVLSIVVWWDAPEIEWEMFSNQIVLHVKR